MDFIADFLAAIVIAFMALKYFVDELMMK